MKKVVILICLIIITGIVWADSAPDTLWTRTFARYDDDKAYSVQQTADGGYIMVGRSIYPGDLNYNAWLIKTDANGDSLWSKTYGDYYIDEAYVVRQTSDGGYIIGGMSTMFGNAGEGWLLRTDGLGNVIWQYGYHAQGTTTSNWDYIYDVLETDDGGFIATGFTGMNVYSHQGWVIRVDADGNEMWNEHFGGSHWDRLFKISRAIDGNYVVAGDRHVLHGTVYSHDGWLMKVSADGDSLWSTTFGRGDTDLFRALCVNEDGTIVCGGQTRSDLIIYAGWLVKTDNDGNMIWNNTYHSNEDEGFITCVIETPDHRNVAGGGIFTTETANDAWLFSTNPNGDIVWDKLIHATNLDDIIDSMERTNDGGYILGGRTNSHSLDGDFWLVKMESDDVGVDDDINITQIMISNFPNPVKNTTAIQYSMQGTLHNGPVKIMIYNTKGQLVDTIVGSNGIASWDTQTHASGVYYYKIDKDKNSVMNKMVIIH